MSDGYGVATPADVPGSRALRSVRCCSRQSLRFMPKRSCCEPAAMTFFENPAEDLETTAAAVAAHIGESPEAIARLLEVELRHNPPKGAGKARPRVVFLVNSGTGE